jgi:hypothetical protein
LSSYRRFYFFFDTKSYTSSILDVLSQEYSDLAFLASNCRSLGELLESGFINFINSIAPNIKFLIVNEEAPNTIFLSLIKTTENLNKDKVKIPSLEVFFISNIKDSPKPDFFKKLGMLQNKSIVISTKIYGPKPKRYRGLTRFGTMDNFIAE